MWFVFEINLSFVLQSIYNFLDLFIIENSYDTASSFQTATSVNFIDRPSICNKY